MDITFPFWHTNEKEKELEPLPLYLEIEPAPLQKRSKEELNEEIEREKHQVIIIQL